MSPVVTAVRELLASDEPDPTPRSRCITKTRILTCDEFRDEMKKKDEEKAAKENAKKERIATRQKNAAEKRKRPTKPTGGNKKKKQKKNTVYNSDSDPDDPSSSSSSSDSDLDEDKCGVCSKAFRQDANGEQWIQCLACKEWFHMGCVKQTVYDPKFKCDECLPLVVRK